MSYIAMNRFRIVKGHESEFEEIWKTRNTYLESEPGFVAFHLLKGPEREDHILYASHTLWESEDHFTAWTKSEAFARHTPESVTGDIFISATRNLKVLKRWAELPSPPRLDIPPSRSQKFQGGCFSIRTGRVGYWIGCTDCLHSQTTRIKGGQRVFGCGKPSA